MKKVLIISYYWPPCGGIGVLRCLKIAKYLREFGWEPIIYTADNADYPSIDESNFKDIDPDTLVLKQPIWEPYKVYRKLTGKAKDANVNNVFYTKEEKAGIAHKLSVWVRSNFFIPDARCMWINSSVKFLTKYLQDNQVDAIFSNGPPHTNTRIATLVKEATGIPWLADFQDPWTQIDYFSLLNLTSWGLAKHKRYEQQAFKGADLMTIVSPTWKKELEDIGAKNVNVVQWGYDPQDYKELKHQPSGKFVISHLGILGYDRNPEILFSAIGSLIKENQEFADRLQIQLPGQVDYSVKESINKHDLQDHVIIPGNINRVDALQMMKDSHILLLLLNKQANAKGRIPGKLFEYLAVRRPILCIGDSTGDSADIVRTTKGGDASEYEDFDYLKSIVLERFTQFENGNGAIDIKSDIDQYSIKRLTSKIAGLLDEIVDTESTT